MRISSTILSIALGCGLNSAVVADSVIDDGYFQYQKPCMGNSVYQTQNSGFMPIRFRKRGEEDGPSSVWALDVSKGGHFCYLSQEQEKIVLWRPDASDSAMLVIEDPNTFEELATIRFRRNKDTQEWPNKVNLADKVVYMMKIGNAYNKVTVHQIPANEADKTKWMEKQGCTQQAEMYQLEVADKSF